MMIHEITSKVARRKPRKRLGRGESSGMGKTSGRGHKGAKSRSGWSLNPQYQGGQINFIQKMPKRGFTNAPFRKEFSIVNVKALEAMASVGDEVTVDSLAAAGVIRDASLPLKVLGEGELTKKLKVTAAKFSASAKAKIEKAGGTANEVPLMKWGRKGPQAASITPAPHVDPKAAFEARQAAAGKEAGKKPKKEKADKGEESGEAKPAAQAKEPKPAKEAKEPKEAKEAKPPKEA
jgi:large subunit ribosomal protein L15